MRSHVERRVEEEAVNVQLTDGELHLSASLAYLDAAQLAVDVVDELPEHLQEEFAEAFDAV